jgi:hypothetical protein
VPDCDTPLFVGVARMGCVAVLTADEHEDGFVGIEYAMVHTGSRILARQDAAGCLMAAQKNSTQATPRQTHKVPKRKLAQTENLPTETSVPADLVLTEAVATPADPPVAAEVMEVTPGPTADSSRLDRPMPAEETSTANSDSSPEPLAPANQLRALDAAAKVLGVTGQSLNCQELITAMAAQGYGAT